MCADTPVKWESLPDFIGDPLEVSVHLSGQVQAAPGGAYVAMQATSSGAHVPQRWIGALHAWMALLVGVCTS